MSNVKVGQIFQDRYMILQELGAGGMGSVFLAKQLDAEREVALKLLHNDAISDEQAIARFHREFKLLSKLSHPNIMTVYGLAMDEQNMPYAVCEFLQGKSLRDLLLQEKTFAWERACRICIQIAQAMQFAHEQGIVHRDLKPENVILQSLPEPDFVKLVDFGLSTAIEEALSDSQKLTRTGQVIGTAFYMSPEQMYKKADERSDIYALGCLLFELLSGEFIFAPTNSADAIHSHQTVPPENSFPAVKAAIPKKLFDTLSAMLKKNPNERVQSMKDLQQRLQACVDQPDTLVDGSSYYSNTKHRTVPGWGIATFLSLLLLAAAAVYFVQQEKLQTVHQNAENKTIYENKSDKCRKEYLRIITNDEQAPVKCKQLITLEEHYRPIPPGLALEITRAAYESIANTSYRKSRPELFYRACIQYGLTAAKKNPELAIKVMQPILQADEYNPPPGLNPRDIVALKGIAAEHCQRAGDEKQALRLAQDIANWEFGISESATCGALGVLIDANDTKAAKKLISRTTRAGYLLNTEYYCRGRERYDLCHYTMNLLEQIVSLGNDKTFFDREKFRMKVEKCRLDEQEGHTDLAQKLLPELLKDDPLGRELRMKEPEGTELAIALKYAGMTDKALDVAVQFKNPSSQGILIQADLFTCKKNFAEARRCLQQIKQLRIEAFVEDPDVYVVDPDTRELRSAIGRLSDLESGKGDYRKGLEDWNNNANRNPGRWKKSPAVLESS